MPVRYVWGDPEQKTVLRYLVEGQWNWNDYHKAVRMSLFALHGLDHDVDVVIDMTGTEKLPAGAATHIRSFGKRDNPCLTGRAIVIGMDAGFVQRLLGETSESERVLQSGDQYIYFVDDEEAAQTLLDQWRR